MNGHDVAGLYKAFSHTLTTRKKPQVIICHTIKGKGIPMIENNPDWHHKTKLTDEEITQLYKGLGFVK